MYSTKRITLVVKNAGDAECSVMVECACQSFVGGMMDFKTACRFNVSERSGNFDCLLIMKFTEACDVWSCRIILSFALGVKNRGGSSLVCT